MKHFTQAELACKHCGVFNLHSGFGEELDALREAFGQPMVVRSGCRCKEHNDRPAAEGGAGGHPLSLHICDHPAHADKGQQGALAIDIATPDGPYRGRLFTIAWTRGWSVGWNAKLRFLHLDRRDWLRMPQTSFDY